CGTPMTASAPPAPVVQPPPAPRPAPVVQPAPAPRPAPVPQPAPQPKAQTAKQALAPGRVPVPTTVGEGPDPNAPNATQFFVAAAGVSTKSMVKRVLFFVLGAILVGTAIYCLVYFQLIKKEAPLPGAGESAEPGVEQPAEPVPPPGGEPAPGAAPAPAPEAAPAPGQPGAANPGAAAPAPGAAVPAPGPAAAVPAPAAPGAGKPGTPKPK
ncbi:MAG TPA: hypothetical protein P5076_09125, partial [Myxococcota bacterium]|nr:hypothetical protein [Myxococcota bacterium]